MMSLSKSQRNRISSPAICQGAPASSYIDDTLQQLVTRPLMQSLRLLRPLRNSLQFHSKAQLSTSNIHRATFSTSIRAMAQEFKLKDVTSLQLKNGEKKEVEVEGVEGGKVLLLKSQDKVHATSATCTHYGAPLVKGVLTPEGRLTCPWHGGKLVPRSKLFSCIDDVQLASMSPLVMSRTPQRSIQFRSLRCLSAMEPYTSRQMKKH